MGLHFLSFWHCGLSFPFILAFSGSASGVPPKSCEKRSVFPMSHIKNLAAPGPASFSNFWPFCAFISLHFGLVGIHFLSFWPCGHSFPFILALWAFISLYFGLVNLHFFHFGIMGLHFLSFWLVGLHFLSFWPCLVGLLSFHFSIVGLQFPFILALWAFISFHFGLVGLHFLAFWACGLLFPCILALWGQLLGSPPQVAKKCPFS